MGWLSRLRDRLRPEEINGGGRCPTYLYRWILLKTRWGNVYLHRFVGDDWSLDQHDHPKRFVSIGIGGCYLEESPDGRRWFCAPWIRTFPAEHRHRITVPSGECWTIVIVGRPERDWGFWVEGVWMHWRRYVETVPDARVAC